MLNSRMNCCFVEIYQKCVVFQPDDVIVSLLHSDNLDLHILEFFFFVILVKNSEVST